MIGTQIFAGKEPRPGLINPVKNAGWVKPRGGLWTSSDLKDGTSDWVRWCTVEQFRGPMFNLWGLEVKNDARVFVIDSMSDLHSLYNKYPGQSNYKMVLDYEKIANDFDGINLTENGQASTRWGSASDPRKRLDLYGWDCERTLWFRWVFGSVKYLGVYKMEEDPGSNPGFSLKKNI